MRRFNYLLAALGTSLLIFDAAPAANAQMMGGYQEQNPPSQSELQDETNMQNAGQTIYKNLQSGKTSCQKLTSDDYEKLGEYFMGLSAGNTENHVYWDNNIQQMMGDQGDTAVHEVWGERDSGCQTNAAIPANTPSFISGMMNYRPTSTNGSDTMMYGYNNSSWNGTDTALTTLLVLAVAAALFAWLRPHSKSVANPLDTMKNRYASGEITKEQYEKLKKDLQ
jgi:hypothetical protein